MTPQASGRSTPAAARPATAGSLMTPSAQAAVLGLRQQPAAGGRAGGGLRTPWATYEVPQPSIRAVLPPSKLLRSNTS